MCIRDSHQQEKLAECHDLARTHIRAAAGAGKTFVALHLMLKELHDDESCYVLFVAKSTALACFIASWLRRRAGRGASKLLRRLHLLAPPIDETPEARGLARYVATFKDGRLQLSPEEKPYALVVVDEAHHVYSAEQYEQMRASVKACITAAAAPRLLLLSDCLLYTSPSPRDRTRSRMPSSA